MIIQCLVHMVRSVIQMLDFTLFAHQISFFFKGIRCLGFLHCPLLNLLYLFSSACKLGTFSIFYSRTITLISMYMKHKNLGWRKFKFVKIKGHAGRSFPKGKRGTINSKSTYNFQKSSFLEPLNHFIKFG